MIGAHTSLAATPIDRWGTEAQKERFLRPLASGRVLGGFGLTEPGSGSDAGAMRTTARKAGDRWIINGSKTWITHGGVGEVFVLGALTSPEQGSRGVTAFVLTKETCDLEDAARVGFGHAADLDPMPGFSAGQKLRKLGWNASDTRETHAEGCGGSGRERARRGGPGFPHLPRYPRRRAGRDCRPRHRDRAGGAGTRPSATLASESSSREDPRLPGRPLHACEAQTRIHAARLMMHQAARLRMAGKPHKKEAAMAKLFASRRRWT